MNVPMLEQRSGMEKEIMSKSNDTSRPAALEDHHTLADSELDTVSDGLLRGLRETIAGKPNNLRALPKRPLPRGVVPHRRERYWTWRVLVEIAESGVILCGVAALNDWMVRSTVDGDDDEQDQ
jgi:hypothetical protein